MFSAENQNFGRHNTSRNRQLTKKTRKKSSKKLILLTYCGTWANVPDSRQAQNLANRFRNHGEAYFRFITTPGIEPTNNLAEQAIRFVVIDRYITQGTRSENGRAWSERIWTVLATCASQGRNAFDFIYQSMQAHFSDQPFPSLLGP